MPNKIRVMLVDDSAVVRGLMQRALSVDPEIEIVATAIDGQMALDMIKRLAVDIIILDAQMQGMDGLTALPVLLKLSPRTRILLSVSPTPGKSEIVMKALELGASDCIVKPFATDHNAIDEFNRRMIAQVRELAAPLISARRVTPAAVTPPATPVKQSPHPLPASALAIASSTGGPQALIEIFRQLKGAVLRVPVFITQHMPPDFTTILAQHISTASGFDCHEAVEGEEVLPGKIYLAPGDYHMTVRGTAPALRMHLNQNPPENFCRPSADPMLRSLAKIYGNKLLVAVLTGIGSDGARGASDVVAAGGTVIAQDASSSVVYGMPKVVAEAKLTSAVLPLQQIIPYFVRAIT